jgi:hypothetical protein
MLALRPELVDVSVVPSDKPFFKKISEYGMMGWNPRTYADPALGESVIESTVSGLSELVFETLRTGNGEPYRALWRSYLKHGIFSRSFLSSQSGTGLAPRN